VSASLAALSVSPIEMAGIAAVPFSSVLSVIEAGLVNPTANALMLVRVPPYVLADRPLEIELAAKVRRADACTVAAIARWISAHALLKMVVDVPGQRCTSYEVPLIVHPSDSGWTARALIHPAIWTNAVCVSFSSLSLAGQAMPCDLLPAIVRAGYNHAPARVGAVYIAFSSGDTLALHAALVSGGSTEEADGVRWSGQSAIKGEERTARDIF